MSEQRIGARLVQNGNAHVDLASSSSSNVALSDNKSSLSVFERLNREHQEREERRKMKKEEYDNLRQQTLMEQKDQFTYGALREAIKARLNKQKLVSELIEGVPSSNSSIHSEKSVDMTDRPNIQSIITPIPSLLQQNKPQLLNSTSLTPVGVKSQSIPKVPSSVPGIASCSTAAASAIPSSASQNYSTKNPSFKPLAVRSSPSHNTQAKASEFHSSSLKGVVVPSALTSKKSALVIMASDSPRHAMTPVNKRILVSSTSLSSLSKEKQQNDKAFNNRPPFAAGGVIRQERSSSVSNTPRHQNLDELQCSNAIVKKSNPRAKQSAHSTQKVTAQPVSKESMNEESALLKREKRSSSLTAIHCANNSTSVNISSARQLCQQPPIPSTVRKDLQQVKDQAFISPVKPSVRKSNRSDEDDVIMSPLIKSLSPRLVQTVPKGQEMEGINVSSQSCSVRRVPLTLITNSSSKGTSPQTSPVLPSTTMFIHNSNIQQLSACNEQLNNKNDNCSKNDVVVANTLRHAFEKNEKTSLEAIQSDNQNYIEIKHLNSNPNIMLLHDPVASFSDITSQRSPDASNFHRTPGAASDSVTPINKSMLLSVSGILKGNARAMNHTAPVPELVEHNFYDPLHDRNKNILKTEDLNGSRQEELTDTMLKRYALKLELAENRIKELEAKSENFEEMKVKITKLEMELQIAETQLQFANREVAFQKSIATSQTEIASAHAARAEQLEKLVTQLQAFN